MPAHRRKRSPFLIGAVIALAVTLAAPLAGGQRNTLPTELTNTEFWSFIDQVSEPDGYFQSMSGSTDNLLSNENNISTVAALLPTRVKPSGVYLGVGPEQNFTYIAATEPRLAFITDIRRGNLHLHLLYKALFETSANRADFVARLFTRPRPAGLSHQSTASELMAAYLKAEPGDDAAFQTNLKAVISHLTMTRHLPLKADDMAGIEYVLRSFHRFGPAITYTSTAGRVGHPFSYATIMSSVDSASGTERVYLASEERFAIVKALQQKNMIIPVVGNFSGPKALRAVGSYLRDHGSTVSAFYVSNVETYLVWNRTWETFCANAATLPLDAASVFIRPDLATSFIFSPIAGETKGCA